MLTLNNKTAIITGASSGIGQATAILFSQLGANVVLSGRDESGLDETINKCPQDMMVKTLKVKGDITERAVCEKIVDEAIKKFGKIDILVNNAGVVRSTSIETMKMEDYEFIMNTNVKAVIVITQLCIPYLLESKGSIVNVSSIAGTRCFPDILAYSMSKAALDQFTQCIALDLADRGVRVNSVNPAVILTNIKLKSGLSKEQFDTFLDESRKTHPMGRPGTVNEVASTIAFLASELSSFITGELIHIDGGRHAFHLIEKI